MTNNHGSFAKVGDFVEAINPMGDPTGLYGIVVGEHQGSTTHNVVVPLRSSASKRILDVLVTWSTGAEIEPMLDSYVRVVSES